MPWAQTNPEGNLAQFGNIQLHVGDVGGLAAALAALRYKQIKDAQDAVVAAGEGIGKEMDKQKSDAAIAAAIQTGQNADLIPQGDYGTGPTAGIMSMDLAKQLEVQRLRDMQQMLDKNHQGAYDAEAAYKNALAGAITSGQRFNSATQGKTQYTLPDGTVVWLTGNQLARMQQGPQPTKAMQGWAAPSIPDQVVYPDDLPNAPSPADPNSARVPPDSATGAPVNTGVKMIAPNGQSQVVPPELVDHYKSQGAVIDPNP